MSNLFGNSGLTKARADTLYTSTTGSISDHVVVRGNGGTKGIQGSGIIIDDSNVLYPATSGTLGSSGNRWSNLYMSSAGSINMGGTVTLAYNSNYAQFSGSGIISLGDILYDNGKSVILYSVSNSSSFSIHNGGFGTNKVLVVGADSVVPGVDQGTNDAGTLGSSAVSWSDLYLALGGAVSWNGGNVTVTHGNNALSFTGATSGYSFDSIVNASTGFRVASSATSNNILRGDGTNFVSGQMAMMDLPVDLPTYNMLTNGNFAYAPQSAISTLTTVSDGSYGADFWNLTRQTANVQYARVDTANAKEIGLNDIFYGRWQKTTSAGKFAIYQVISGVRTYPLCNKTITWAEKFRTSAGSKTMRMSVLQLTSGGVMDTIPTLVSNWSAESIDPIWGANITTASTPQSKSVTTAWGEVYHSATVSSAAKNLILTMWSDSSFASNDVLYTAEAQLLHGTISARTSGTANVPTLPNVDAEDIHLTTRTYTPSWGGFSSPPTGGSARYMRVGNMCYVSVSGYAAGTSNSTTKTITMPLPSKVAVVMAGMGHTLDNGAFSNNPGRIDTRAGATTADLYRSLNADAWTSAGTAVMDFVLFYEINGV